MKKTKALKISIDANLWVSLSSPGNKY